jgi:hypothetical protein
MRSTKLPRAVALAAIIVVGVTADAAQTTAADPHHLNWTVAQATPPSGMMGQGSGAQSGQPGMMGQGMMGQGMMGHSMMGMMGGMPMAGMRGNMVKIMFAIADMNGDGGLSFDEVTTIHRRIFDKVDANKDAKVTPEEVQAFMRE